MIRICKEESFHQRQGFEIMLTLCRGSTPAQKAMAQDALDRFWWPVLMMFGPSDKESLHSADTMKWKIKRFSNDDLRQKFIDATVPQGHYLGLTFPDPELKFDETTGHWRFGEIDWSEFKRVLAGDGPCNRQRMTMRTRGARGRRLGARGGAGARAKARRAGGGGKDCSGVEDMIAQPAGTHLAQLNVGHIRFPPTIRAWPSSWVRSTRQRAGRAQPGFRVAPQGRRQQCHRHPGHG